jgi:hypothetical protein
LLKGENNMIILPDRSEIYNPYYPNTVAYRDFEQAVNRVYAQAITLDIDALAEEWMSDDRNHHVSGLNVQYTKATIKFSDFIAERMSKEKLGK